jgi:hypothetical protein
MRACMTPHNIEAPKPEPRVIGSHGDGENGGTHLEAL